LQQKRFKLILKAFYIQKNILYLILRFAQLEMQKSVKENIIDVRFNALEGLNVSF